MNSDIRRGRREEQPGRQGENEDYTPSSGKCCVNIANITERFRGVRNEKKLLYLVVGCCL